MAISSPRAQAQFDHPAVPIDWYDAIEHRRKIAEALEQHRNDSWIHVNSAATLRGTPPAVTVSTTRVVITGWPTVEEGPNFQDKANGTTGQITIPRGGIYNVIGTIVGLLNGGTQNEDVLLFLRSSIQGDRPISSYLLVPTRTSWLSWGWAFATAFTENEVLSLAVDATANLGNLTFWPTNFTVEYKRQS